ncbi:Sporulation integral membrane protein YlbJ [compost metagenome]
MLQAAAAAFILSWGGLSVHAQVASILNETDLRYTPFLLARLIHAVMAACMVIGLWRFTMGPSSSVFHWANWGLDQNHYMLKWNIFITSFSWLVYILLLMIVLSLFAALVQYLKRKKH